MTISSESGMRSPILLAGLGAIAMLCMIVLAATLRGPERPRARPETQQVAAGAPPTSSARASAAPARASVDSPLTGLFPKLFESAEPAAPAPPSGTSAPSGGVVDALAVRATIDTMKTQLRRNDLGGALTTLEKLAAETPEAARDPELREAIVDLSQRVTALRTDAPRRFFTILSEKMGPTGIDVLYYLVSAKGASDAAKLAGDLLGRDDVVSRGSKAMQIAWALRNAKGCDAKRALFDRAKEDGDARSYGQLVMLDRQCGRRRHGDPTCCMPNDPALKSTLTAMRARGVE